MPCNSDYMDANHLEQKISQVACLLDELEGRKFSRDSWNGYHPRVYNKCTKVLADDLVATLCKKLQTRDVSKYSLEMQIWWRDHQEADRKRVQKELKEKKEKKDKEIAISKLSPYERKLLGVDRFGNVKD